MQPENGTVPVRKDDLDILVAACTSYLPPDVSPHVSEAFGRVLKSFDEVHGIFDEVHGIAEDVPGRPPPGDGPALGDGQFMAIAFMGHIEREGYVTEITLGGEPGYHVDLPDKLWGGNPYAWEEYSAKVLFSRCPVPEETIRVRWETERKRAAERARREAEWQRMQEQRALTSGEVRHAEDPDCDWTGQPGNFAASPPADLF